MDRDHRASTGRRAAGVLLLALAGLVLAMPSSRDASASLGGDARRIEITSTMRSSPLFSIEVSGAWRHEPGASDGVARGTLAGENYAIHYEYGVGLERTEVLDSDQVAQSWAERVSCARADFRVEERSRASDMSVRFEDTGRPMQLFPVRSEQLALRTEVMTAEHREAALTMLRSLRFDDVCIVGRTGDWTIFETPHGSQPNDIDMTSASTGWIVGEIPDHGERDLQCSILRYVAQLWHRVPCPIERFLPRGIDMFDEQHGWVVGAMGIFAHSHDGWIVEMDWDDLEATSEKIDSPRGVGAISRTEAWTIDVRGTRHRTAAGWSHVNPRLTGSDIDTRRTGAGFALLFDWDVRADTALYVLRDGRWIEHPGAETYHQYYDVVAAATDEDAILAGSIWGHSSRADVGVISHIPGDGSTSHELLENVGTVHGVNAWPAAEPSAAAPMEIWVLADPDSLGGRRGPGLILHKDPSDGTWERLELPFDSSPSAIDFSGPDEGWAVVDRFDPDGIHGRQGILMHYQAHSLRSLSPPRSERRVYLPVVTR